MNASLLPTAAKVFTEAEEDLFEDIVDEAEIDALVEALFPDSLTKGPPA